jgi:hypothetical protein
MDDLPVPQGSWQSHHDSNQAKYNIHLIGGVTVLTLTLGFVSIYRFFFCGSESEKLIPHEMLQRYWIRMGFFGMACAV